MTDLPVAVHANEPVRSAPYILDLSQQHSDADLTLYANRLMRERAQIDAEVKSLTAAAKRDVDMIAAGWSRVAEPLKDRAGSIDEELGRVAKLLHYPGEAKSRKLPAGIIGTRTQPARIEIADASLLLAWAEKEAPAFVSTKTTRSVLHDSVVAWQAANPGKPLPPGVKHIDAWEKPTLTIDPVLHVRVQPETAAQLAR